MILSDTMIQSALDLQKATPWKTITNGNIIAIKLSNGDTGYCVTTGTNGKEFSLQLHESIRNLCTYLDSNAPDDDADIIKLLRALSKMDNIIFSFMKKGSLEKKEINATKKYFDAHNITLPSSLGWPHFFRVCPGTPPDCITRQQDADHIVEAIKAVTYMATHPSEVPVHAFAQDYVDTEDRMMIPLLTPQQEGQYEITSMKMPEKEPETFPMPLFKDKALAKRILALPKGGQIQCKNCELPIPSFDEKSGLPCFPETLIWISLMQEHLHFTDTESAVFDLPNALKNFGEQLIKEDKRPASIIVADEKTKNLLTDFCKQCGIALCVQQSVDFLDDAFEEFLDGIREEAQQYLDKEEEENKDIAPQSGTAASRKKEHSANADKSTYSKENYPRYLKRPSVQKYTLRITLKGIKPAIWRKIDVPSNISLRLLSELIIDLMGWKSVHLNYFKVANSDYYIPYYQLEHAKSTFSMFDAEALNQEDYTISDVLNVKGRSITFEYDLGDKWCHEIRLSSVNEYKEDEEHEIAFVGGECACPPENCGGAEGYLELMELRKKKKSGIRLTGEDKEHYERYLNDNFDPEYLDLEECEDTAAMYNV